MTLPMQLATHCTQAAAAQAMCQHGWIDGWMDGWMGGWMDGWLDEFWHIFACAPFGS